MSSPLDSPLRSLFLGLSQSRSLRGAVETSSLFRPLTRRFIAGQDLADAIGVVRVLRQDGIHASLDYLGENVGSSQEALKTKNACLDALRVIALEGLPATISIKLTALGLDSNRTMCEEFASELVEKANEIGSAVEMDMEGSAYTDRTLQAVHRVHRKSGSVRAVIQAYLHRSEEDIRELNASGIPVRLCKGAYREPAEHAIADKAGVDANFIKLMHLLFREGSRPAIASHDDRIVSEAVRQTSELHVDASRFEFQMLYGVRRDLQKSVKEKGYQLRLYVPYGEAWYPYFMRRLAERPANVMFLVQSLFKP